MSHRVTILAIDPGKTSGFAVLQPPFAGGGALSDGLVTHGIAKGIGDLQRALQAAEQAATDELPLVVVGESWKGSGGRHGMSAQTMTGIGASWGRWQAIVELSEHPMRRVVRLDTGTWRMRLFGRSRLKSAVWKHMAVDWVRQRYGTTVTTDEAEAIAIGWVAQRSPEVAAVLPKSARTG